MSHNFEVLKEAMFSEAFPCNPRPFAIGLEKYVAENGTASIKSDDAKQILWILMAQAYGQLAVIDLCDEWNRLNEANKIPPPPSKEEI